MCSDDNNWLVYVGIDMCVCVSVDVDVILSDIVAYNRTARECEHER